MLATLEIAGNITAPYIPDLPEGSPRLTVSVTGLAGGTEQLLATCSAQASGSPMPFRLHLDRASMTGMVDITLDARCTAGTGKDAVLARMTQSLTTADAARGIPLQLSLEPVGIAASTEDKHPIQPVVMELSGYVSVPPELCQETAYLDATLLVVQDDGRSNRYASNLAEHSLYLKGNGAPFSLFVDTATVPDGLPAKLHLGLYDKERRKIFAGNVVRDLDLSNPPDLSAIVLRKPRR